ncbi:MAG: hypothetical protein HUU35_06145, partial [Armatimonadetes bacterium]|nr:hypothetical protein [Armatimonadota bacterium]
MQATGKMPADYLLGPIVYEDPDEFAAALRQVGDEAQGGVLHPELPAALAWARPRAGAEITRVLTALETVGDLPQLLAVLNDTPGLLEPAVIGRLASLAEEAEATGEDDVAEVLSNVAAVLRAHLPYREDDLSEGEPPAELGGILLGGDLEAAAQYLERPAPREDEETRRAMLNTFEPELREGFVEHARLFGGLLDSMMEEDGLATDEAALVEGLDELEGLEELVEAPTIDAAMLVLDVYPQLISREAVTLLRRAEEAALDGGQEALASHLEMLVNTIYVMAEDEDALEGGDDGR